MFKSHQIGGISKLVLKYNQILGATLKKETKTMEKIVQEAHDTNMVIKAILQYIFLYDTIKYNMITKGEY